MPTYVRLRCLNTKQAAEEIKAMGYTVEDFEAEFGTDGTDYWIMDCDKDTSANVDKLPVSAMPAMIGPLLIIVHGRLFPETKPGYVDEEGYGYIEGEEDSLFS